jgi:hypothetical protein
MSRIGAVDMSEIHAIVQRHMELRPVDVFENGRAASVLIQDDGALLVWCGGKPVWYADNGDAVRAAADWTRNGHSPNARPTMRIAVCG